MVGSIKLNTAKSSNGKYICGSNFVTTPTSMLNGNNVFGSNCRLGNNCTVTNSVIWDNVKVEDNITIENSIILPGVTVKKSINNGILAVDREKIEQPV